MVDFLKRMQEKKAQQAERIEPKLEIQPTEQTLSWLDKLAYMVDECDLNAWEKQFTASVTAWLLRDSNNRPSIKQAAKITEMFKDYELQDCISDGTLFAGYYEQTRKNIAQSVDPGEAYRAMQRQREEQQTRKQDRYGFDDMDDDMDDDIPF